MNADIPPLFEEAHVALMVWDIERTAENHEHMVELYESVRRNEESWKAAGAGVFKMYRDICHQLEDAVDEGVSLWL